MAQRAKLRLRSAAALARFARDERGTMTLFGVYIFMMMLLVGGIGVDLMRNEMERVRLQNTVDRAVLAAADLDQELDPTAVVNDYFAKAGMSSYVNSVTINEGLNFRIVTADASTASQTQFMRLMGVPDLPVPAISQAEERIANVEISMVLDISGSMGSNNKIKNMRDAAKVFVDTVIREETEDLISLSMVPYSEHVNAGPDLFGAFKTIRRHNYSFCMEFPNSEYTKTKINRSLTYDQGQHFQWGYDSKNRVNNPMCPKQWYEQVVTHSQNATDLKNRIGKMQARGSTSIFLGMKWAVGLLDPDFNTILRKLNTAGKVDNEFISRPAAYSDVETLKTIVLMTDGRNHYSNRIASWAYDAPSEYVHWSKNNFWYWLYDNVHHSQRHYYYNADIYTPSTGDFYLDQICDAAKAKGIVVWSIGFEVDNHGATQMKNCASSPSHFFRVEGVEISEAFEAIARSINQLRLTQ
ncbi:MAG: TadE/TadG family type IV pilus assembly protein [Pseudomonadota bacterium]